MDQDGAVLTVTFNRPRQRNAMTWATYDACGRADSDISVRVMVLRANGEKAFIAGTDITQFSDCTTGAQGVEHEDEIAHRHPARGRQHVHRRLDPWLLRGGGLSISPVCDLSRLDDRPVRRADRTLGNCLSMNNYSMLLHHLGPAITLDVLLRARLLTGEEAKASGFVTELCEGDQLEARTAAVVETLLGQAPLSIWAVKEAVRRLRRAQLPDGDDIVSRDFGSDDFQRAVKAFAAEEPMTWEGR